MPTDSLAGLRLPTSPEVTIGRAGARSGSSSEPMEAASRTQEEGPHLRMGAANQSKDPSPWGAQVTTVARK